MTRTPPPSLHPSFFPHACSCLDLYINYLVADTLLSSPRWALGCLIFARRFWGSVVALVSKSFGIGGIFSVLDFS